MFFIQDTPSPEIAAPDLHESISEFKNLSLDEFISVLSEKLINFAIDLVVAILVFYAGRFVIKRIYRFIAAIMVKRNADKSLTTFILSFVKIVLYFVLIIIVVGIIGIETSSFLALFASAGVAIGLALSGTLQNFAGGVLILLLKPYKIGDYIEAQGYAGTIKEIQIFYTIITTPDNKAILIPNGALSTSSVNNYSKESYRRVSWTVSISYGDDVDAARKAILSMFEEDHRIVQEFMENDPIEEDCPEDNPDCKEKEPEPKKPGFFRRIFGNRRKVKEAISKWEERHEETIRRLQPRITNAPVVFVNELAASSVDLTVRAWTRSENYWPVFFDYNERIYKELPSYGIRFPFPQMDVHIDGVTQPK